MANYYSQCQNGNGQQFRQVLKKRYPVDMKEREICAICGKNGKYKYYNAYSCEACKQFFRRVLIVQYELVCSREGRCDPAEDKCRSCRLDKCLLSGMDPHLVVTQNEEENARKFIAKLQRRREGLQQRSEDYSEGERCHSQQLLATSKSEALNFPYLEDMAQLARLVHGHRRIWGAGSQIAFEHLKKHENLADFLGDRNNLLGRAEEAEYPDLSSSPFWNGPEFDLFTDAIKSSIHHIFLATEFAKSLPFFRQLHLEEQTELLQRTLCPAIMLSCTFYSAEMGADVWQTGNGLSAIAPLQNSPRLWGDQKIRQFCKKLFCDTVQIVEEAGIGREEMALLWAILLTSTGIDASDSTRSLLYEECGHFTKMLLRLALAKYGQLEGAKRFAVAMNLVNVTLKYKYNLQSMLTYVEVFYSKKSKYGFHICPKAVEPLWAKMNLF